jgi:hypothetical protein
MRASPTLLQLLRLTPEPLKRRLRPALLSTVRLAARVPGAYRAARIAQAVAPGAHGWVLRRFQHYAESAEVMKPIIPARGHMAPPSDLSAAERLVFAQLRGLAGRLPR